jgi:hypothetical protein
MTIQPSKNIRLYKISHWPIDTDKLTVVKCQSVNHIYGNSTQNVMIHCV